MGETNILNKLPTSASNLYAKNVFNFVINLYDKENKKININNPLSGSFAKVWTEFKIPDLTKKVPHILNANVDIDNIITQEVSINLFSKTKMHWKSVVKASQGIKETFSTGSQNQKPPHPNS